ncbi:hypothetical protein TNCV_2533831 [Trichonephila clavipes]|nr:hypothetical protein TNCV_2533831 [Trichonephila clavipes]
MKNCRPSGVVVSAVECGAVVSGFESRVFEGILSLEERISLVFWKLGGKRYEEVSRLWHRKCGKQHHQATCEQIQKKRSPIPGGERKQCPPSKVSSSPRCDLERLAESCTWCKHLPASIKEKTLSVAAFQSRDCSTRGSATFKYAGFVSDCNPVIKMLERTATIREDPEVSEVLFVKNCLKAVLYCNKCTFKDGGNIGVTLAKRRHISPFLNVNAATCSITQSV